MLLTGIVVLKVFAALTEFITGASTANSLNLTTTAFVAARFYCN
jgi:hypothetical protein